MAELPAGTVTFLFTDIEGSTQLLKRLGDSYAEILAEHQRLIRQAAEERGGREVDTQGDSFFFAFARANAALGAAVVAQRALAEHQWPDGARVRVRMGLHTGEPLVGEERYVGLGVHRAARIGAVGHGGQVLLSNATRELVEDDTADVSVRDLGTYRLKDIDRPERLFQLDIAGLQTDFPPLKAERISEPRAIRRRTVLLAGLAGVLAAAVAIPLFAFAQSRSDDRWPEAAAGNSVALVDARSSRLIADIAVGTTPAKVAVGDGAAWVTNTGDGTVDRVDLATRTLRQTIRVGEGPDGVAVGGGSVWVANGLDGTVSRIDPLSGTQTQTIAVGNGPSGIAYGRGAIWVVSRDDRTVTRVDPATGNVERTLEAGLGPLDVAVGAGAVWVSSDVEGKVLRLDPATGATLETIPVGRGPGAIAASADAVWVANATDGTVSRIDPHTSSVVAVIEVGGAPRGIAVAGDAVWVASEGNESLVRIDAGTNQLVRTIELGGSPAGIAASAEAIFVAVRPATGLHRGGTLNVVGSAGFDWGSVDPALVGGGVATITNDGLTGFRRVGGRQSLEIVPNLALSVPQPTSSGRAYTFRVREGIRYSTGAEVRPADFRRAIERNFEVRGDFAFLWASIVGARKCMQSPGRCDLSRGIVADDDARTVTFRLAEADPDLPVKLALPFASALPESTPGMRLKPRDVPATGPYRIAAYAPGRQLRLVRNPHFREWSRSAKPDGHPDEIVMRFDVEAPEQVRSVARGQADVADLTDSREVDFAALRARHGGRLRSSSIPVVVYLWLNTRVPPFDDVRVRRALNYAVDREAMAEAAGGPDVASPSCQVLPANFRGYRPYCPYAYDPDRARSLVAASGTRGMRVVVWSRASLRPVYQKIVETLRSLGFRAQLRIVDDFDYFETIDKLGRTAAHAGWAGWIPDYPAPGNYLSGMLGYFEKRTGFSDPTVDEAMARALELQQTDPAAADDAWAGLDRRLVDRAPFVPLYNLRGTVLTSERSGNVQYHPLWGTLVDQIWVR